MPGRGHGSLLNIERPYRSERRKTVHFNGILCDILYHRNLKLDIDIGIFLNCYPLSQNNQKSFLPAFQGIESLIIEC